MTLYTATPSSNLQSMINALLPGDILELTGGVYSNAALNIGVSGSPTQPITIRGVLNADGSFASALRTPGGTTQGVKVTGSYIHFHNITLTDATRALEISGSSHCKFYNLELYNCPNEGVWVHNSAHHIFLWGIRLGDVNQVSTKNFTIAFRIGTPSSGWANVNTPDRTNNIHLYDTASTWNMGWGVDVCPGAHHILIEDVYADLSSGDTRPVRGAANGDGGFHSAGDDVQFVRCFCTAPTTNYFKIETVTIGGVKYGLRQEIKGGGGRPSSQPRPTYVPGVSSNCGPGDLRVYRTYFDVFPVAVSPFEDLGNWAASGWLVPGGLFTKIDIAGPARAWTKYPVPHGHLHAWHELRCDYKVPDNLSHYDNDMNLGIEFVVDRPNGRLVGFAYYRIAEGVKPKVVRLYDEEWYSKSQSARMKPSELPPVGALLEDFNSYDEWWEAEQQAFANYFLYLTYYTDWLQGPYYQAIPQVTKVITHPPFTVPKWEFVYFDNSYPLEVDHHYIMGMFVPSGVNVVGFAGWTMGIFPPDFWGRSHGASGINNGPLKIPTAAYSQMAASDINPAGGEDNRDSNKNLICRYNLNGPIRQGYLSPALPGEQIAYPDASVLYDALIISPIVSFAREDPETRIVGPGDDLQAVLDSRIPGDLVIISGAHKGEYVMRESGTAAKPIRIKGDGTARVLYRHGRLGALPALRVSGSYIWFENIIFEESGAGVLIENAAKSVRVEGCEARFVRDAGFVAQEDATDIYFLNCVSHDTGRGLTHSEAFRIGRHAGYWVQDGHPDATSKVLLQGCSAYRSGGFVVCDGATDVVVKSCSMDFTQGSAPPPGDPEGRAGFYSRADRIQFISCTVLGAPGAGFRIFDSTYYPNATNFGRLQEVKGGSSTGHGDAGVVSQSEGCKVYSDFTASSPRIREIEGGWSAAGSNVAASSFVERAQDSIAQHYAPVVP